MVYRKIRKIKWIKKNNKRSNTKQKKKNENFGIEIRRENTIEPQ